MKKVTIRVELSARERKDKFEFEVSDNMSEEDIEFQAQEAMQEWANEYIDAAYEIVSVEDVKED